MNYSGYPNMNLLQDASIYCPYCGESLEILVDGSVGMQKYIEDCQVCCKPMVICVGVAADGSLLIEARHEDEA